MVLDGGEMMRKVAETELQQQYNPQNDPEKPPPKGPGDKYYAIGALIGVIVGAVIGGLLSRFGGLMLFNIIGGAVVLGFIGVSAGSLMKKRHLRK
jgi:predicted lipid-binding transport protein (Tim44 family)